MAIQSQPSRIPEPFAGSGTKNVIPATNTTPSASQAASWASGFPPECSQPISAGGCPVPRNDVNGALNWLSQDFAFRQDGGVWAWSALADYDTGRFVRGSDTSFYKAVAQNGPGTGAGAKDPIADNGTYWVKIPSMADIVAQGFALDNSVMHLYGNETAYGIKTFKDSTIFDDFITINGINLADINLMNLTADISSNIPPTGNAIAAINIFDKNGKNTSSIYNSLLNTRESLAFQLWPDGINYATLYFSYWYGTQNYEFYPSSNGLMNLGNGANRWQAVYAATGTIQTSDERLKRDVAPIPDEVLDVWESIGFVQFQFNDAFAKKGASARLHSGLVAQRIDEAFKAAGLDARKYGFFCWDSWEAQDEERNGQGDVVQEARAAGEQYSLRYEEVLCMEAACQRRRADRAEARLAALEERLAAIEAKLNVQH